MIRSAGGGAVMPASIRCGDCLELLPQLPAGSVDLALTDPPYAVSRDTGFKAVKSGVERFAVSMDFGEWDHAEPDLPSVCAELYRVLRRGGTAIVFYDLWKLTKLADALTGAGFVQLRFIEWIKTNPVPLNSKRNYLTNAREVAVSAVKGGSPTFHGEYDSGIYSHPIARAGQGRKRHPTEKPVALMRELVEKHSNPGDLVLDPFAGSGSTGVAAAELGRRFIGFELSEEYADLARARLSE